MLQPQAVEVLPRLLNLALDALLAVLVPALHVVRGAAEVADLLLRLPQFGGQFVLGAYDDLQAVTGACHCVPPVYVNALVCEVEDRQQHRQILLGPIEERPHRVDLEHQPV